MARIVALVLLLCAVALAAPSFGNTKLTSLVPAKGISVSLNGEVVPHARNAWTSRFASTLKALGAARLTSQADTMAWIKAGIEGTHYLEAALMWNQDWARWTVLQANITAPTEPEAPVSPKVKDAYEVSAMSFNIRMGTANDGDNSWPYRSHLVMDLINRHSTLLVGLQEAFYFQMEEILAACPDYWYVGVGREDGVQQGEHSSILYKPDIVYPAETGTFWFCDEPYTPGCTSYGNSVTRISTWARFVDIETQASFFHFNLHADHQSQVSRELSVAQLIEHIDAFRPSGLPFIVSGDFNSASENTTELVDLREYGFVDTFRALYPDAVNVGTFNSFVGTTTGVKIDYVFVSTFTENTSVLAAEIIHDNDNGQYPSDHFPVSATVVFG